MPTVTADETSGWHGSRLHRATALARGLLDLALPRVAFVPLNCSYLWTITSQYAVEGSVDRRTVDFSAVEDRRGFTQKGGSIGLRWGGTGILSMGLAARGSKTDTPQAVISPFVLLRIGAHARRYFLTGERFGADVALRIGLVSEVADGDLDERIDAVVSHLLAGGPEAVRAAKELVRNRPNGQAAAEIAAARRTSAEGQDGLRAFLEKRTPAWRSESSS